jgi:hypothetical protein
MSEAVQVVAKTPVINKETQSQKAPKLEVLQSMDSPLENILFLQRTIGNQAVARLISSGAIRTKLRIGQPGDKCKQEIKTNHITEAELGGMIQLEPDAGQTTSPGIDWMSILPDAQVTSGMQASPGRPGGNAAQSPLLEYQGDRRTTTYRQNRGQQIADAGPTPSGITQQNIDTVCASIIAARNNITERYLKPVKEASGTGYQVNPGAENQAATRRNNPDPIAQAGKPQTDSYQGWLRTATPTDAIDAAMLFKWNVFRWLMRWEGTPDTVMTYDRKNVTWGAGFAGRGGENVAIQIGQFEQLMERLIRDYPPAAGFLLSAGVTISGRELIVVDPDPGKQWKLHAEDAELYMRSNRKLLSLLINMAQGANLGLDQAGTENMQQAVLDANFRQFLASSGASLPASGDAKLWALKVHMVHAGGNLPKSNDIPSVITEIKLAKPAIWTYIVPCEWWMYGDPNLNCSTDRQGNPLGGAKKK